MHITVDWLTTIWSNEMATFRQLHNTHSANKKIVLVYRWNLCIALYNAHSCLITFCPTNLLVLTLTTLVSLLHRCQQHNPMTRLDYPIFTYEVWTVLGKSSWDIFQLSSLTCSIHKETAHFRHVLVWTFTIYIHYDIGKRSPLSHGKLPFYELLALHMSKMIS